MLQYLGAAFIGGIVLTTGALAGPQAPTARPATAPKATTSPGAPGSQKAPANWKAPRTPWGDPDIQGTWNNGTITPLERPRTAGEKELLSKEEEEEINAQSDTRAEQRPTNRAQDVELAYNQFWWDRGASIGRTSLIIDPKDGRIPPVTANGQRLLDAQAAARRGRGAGDSYTDRPLQERCILYHGVPPLPTGYNNNYEIVQTPGLVAIVHEEIHETRSIWIDGRPHLPATVTAWLGDSRGHFEGDTLVVETTNFHPDATFRFPVDIASLRIIERFRRIGPDDIDYQFTVDNPTMYTKQWTATLPMRREKGLIYEYACHEGNHALPNVLAGFRFQESESK